MGPRCASDEASFSLVRGGPFHALCRALHLVRGDARDPLRQAGAFVALAWVPLAIAELGLRLLAHRWSALIIHPSTHVRLLVAVPLLFASEGVLDQRSRRCIARFVEDDLVPGGSAAIGRALARAGRLRDHPLPETLLAVLALGGGQAVLWGLLREPGVIHLASAVATPSVARIWWCVVALPVSNFLLYRALWRWLIWSLLMCSLSRLDVRPLALHPDRRAGLELLAEPIVGFAFVVMSFTSLLASAWGARMMFEGATLEEFAPTLAETAALALILAFGPLCTFAPCMQRARSEAIRQYQAFALAYARLFHHKWIEAFDPDHLLGTPDLQSMADLSTTLAIVQNTRLVPFGKRDIAIVLAAIAIPVVPLVMATVPLVDLLKAGRIVIGGVPQ